LKTYAIRSHLRKTAKALKKAIDVDSDSLHCLHHYLETKPLQEPRTPLKPLVTAYLIISWVLEELKLTGSPLPGIDQVVLADLLSHKGLGSVSMLRPDGSQAPGSPFNPESIWGAWAVSIDGNDHVWVSNFAPGGGITELCGARPETCPPGMKTGDPISPPGGYTGGGMQMLVDVSIDPAGNVWVSNNWQDPSACYGKAEEGFSTRCGGLGMVVFPGMAKPVRAPQIGPARPF
jgi:hypothetical protein